MVKKIPKSEWHQSQRGYFAGALYNAMVEDKDIFLIVGDLGYRVFDKHFEDFPERCINVGAAETAGVGISVGLALKGRKPIFYSITTFLLRRPYEVLKLYLDGENIPVRLVGSGRDKDYAHDGPSHDASDAPVLMGTLPHIECFWPEEKEEIPRMVEMMVKEERPWFISLRR